MEVLEIVRREYDGQMYQVTIYQCSQVMPWGTEPCSFKVAKWQKLGPTQLDMFSDAV